MELAEGRRPWEERGLLPPYVEFCLRMIAALTRSGAVPVLVFDGGKLPAKEGTNQQRRERKQAAADRAQGLLELGQLEEARAVLAQTVDVTHDMAQELMAILRQQCVEYLVAPFEADSQLAFLCTLPAESGGVVAVVTEDSDLVAFGCRRVLFKCDTAGNALELCMDALFAGPPPGAPAGVASFAGWDLAMLQGACVLAGCDYLPSIRGVSFKTAHKLIKAGRSLERALRNMRLEKRWQLLVSSEYCDAALRALHGFSHALVFDPNAAGGGGLVRLSPLPHQLASAADKDLSYLGPILPDEVARGICYGHLHPRTRQPYPGAPGPPFSTPTIATRQRLASWMVNAAPTTGHARHGLGPSRAAVAAAPRWQEGSLAIQRSAWHQQMPAAEDASTGEGSRTDDLLRGLGAAWQSGTAATSATTPALSRSQNATMGMTSTTGVPAVKTVSCSTSCNPFASARVVDKDRTTGGVEQVVAATGGGTAEYVGHQLPAGKSHQSCSSMAVAASGSCSAAEQPSQLLPWSGWGTAAAGLAAPVAEHTTLDQAAEGPTALEHCSSRAAAGAAWQRAGQEPLAPLTNRESMQAMAPSQESCEEAGGAGMGQPSWGVQPKAQQQQQQQQQQQSTPQLWGAGPPGLAKCKEPAARPGSSKQGSRGKRKKGSTNDASQTRLSRFFSLAPQQAL